MSKQIAKNTFTGGLLMDLHPLSSQNTVLTNALNATLVTIDGDEMILLNDMGNLKATYTQKNGEDGTEEEVEVTLTPDFIPIGINTLNGIAYIVSFNPNKQEGEIGTFPSPQYNLDGDLLIDDNNYILDENLEKIDKSKLINKYQPLYNLYKGSVDDKKLIPKQENVERLLWAMRTTHFNFDLEHPVNIELQPSYDGSINIIINDGKNIPRLINSRFSAREDGTWEIPDRYKNTNNIYKTTSDDLSSNSYKEPLCYCPDNPDSDSDLLIKDSLCGCYPSVSCEDEINNQKAFDISTALNKRVDFFPIIEYNGVVNNGNLPVGNYVLYFKYCDEDENETDFIGESGIISIFKGNDKDPFSIDGGERDMDSNKSISVTLKTDPHYSFVKVYYSRTSAAADENRIPQAYELIKIFPISDDNVCNIIITGDEEKQQIPLTDLNQQYVVINNSESQVQIANRLFLGNIETQVLNYKDLKDISLRVIPYIRRLKAEEKIGYINPLTYLDSSGISESTALHKFKNEYYNTKNIYYNVGYWNEEYYRLGIVYIYEDGSLSPVFNILGYRTANSKYSEAESFYVLEDKNNNNDNDDITLFNIPHVYNTEGERNYLSIDKSGNVFNEEAEENQIISPASEIEVSQINTRGVINIVDSELENIKDEDGKIIKQEAQEYLYNIRISMSSEIIDYLKNVLCIKGFFIVRQKRIPTILAQGYTLPWDKEAKVPIIEHWNTRLMPFKPDPKDSTKTIDWGFDQTFKNYKANDVYGDGFTWHYYWNSFSPNKSYKFTELRCYEVESFLDQLSDGGRHLDANDGYDYGHPNNRKLMHHYLPRMHDIPFICVDLKMLAPFEKRNSEASSSGGYILIYKLLASYDNGKNYSASLDNVVSKVLFDDDVPINSRILLQETKGLSITYKSFNFNSEEITPDNVINYDIIEQYITSPEPPTNVGELGELTSTEITINGQLKDYQEGDTSWGSAVSAINTIHLDPDFEDGYSGPLNIYRFLMIVVTTATFNGDEREENTYNYYPFGNSIQLVSDYSSLEEEGYDSISGLITSLYKEGYLKYREYFRDLFVDTIDGKITQNKSTKFENCGSYKDLQRDYNDGRYIRRLGNYYMLWKIRGRKWKEIDKIEGADELWTKALQKHYGDLYRHVDGNQLTAICPEFEVRQPFFNQLFTGSEYPVRYTTYQHGVLHRDVENGRGNERYYYPKVEKNDIYCPTHTHNFDKFGAKSGMKYKICSVTDNVPIVAIDNTIFLSVLGSDQEAYRIAYINEEHAGKALWTKDDSHDNHFYSSENKHDWNLIRGIFSPYLGMISSENIRKNFINEEGKEESAEQTERDRRYCRTFNIYIEDFDNTEMQFNIRFQDSSPYYPISERICFNYKYDNYIPEYRYDKENKNLIYDLYRGDCFLCTFTHRLNRNFNDPVAPTNDKIVDEATWLKHYLPDEDTQKSDISQLSKINRGDVNAVKLGSWITVKVRSSYNLSIRSLDERYTSEAAMMGRARGFYPLQQASADGGYKIPNSYLINDGFGSTVGEKIYNTLPDAPYYNNVFEDRIVYSDVNIQDAYKNGYRTFKISTITDYTKQYGKIVKLVDWYGHIICVFEHAVGILPVNERVESGQGIGGPVFVNSNKILSDVPSIISDKFGSYWKDSIIKTPYAIYGVDTSTKKIWKITGSTTLPTLSVISDFKIENFLKEHLDVDDTEQQVQIALRNVKSHYNLTKSDVIFTFYMTNTNRLESQLNKEKYDEEAWSLCLNEITSDQNSGSSGNFVTFYSWIPLESFNLNNKFYSFDRNLVRGILSFYDVDIIPDDELIEYVGKPVYDLNGILVDESIINYCKPKETYYRRTYKYPKKCMTALNIWEHNNPFIRPLPTHWYGHQHPFEFEFMVIEDPSVQKIWEDLKIVSNNAKPESFHFAITGDNYEFTKDIPNIFYRQEATKELYSNLGSPISYNKDYVKVHPNQLVKSTIFPLYYNRIDVYDNIYDLYQLMTGDYRDYQNLSGTEIYRNPRSRKYEMVTHIKNTPIDGEWVRITKQNAEELLKELYKSDKDFDTQLDELYNLYYDAFNTAQRDCNLKLKKVKNPEQAFECEDNNYWYYLWVQQSRLRGNSHYKEDKWNIQIPTITLMLKNEDRWTSNIKYNGEKYAEENLEVPPLVLNWIPKLSKYTIDAEDLPNTYSIGQVSTDKWTFRKETKLRDKYCRIKVRYSGEELAIISAILTTFNISYA